MLHIGPHKTGTTALQEALRQARPDLLEQGVRHAGPLVNDADGVRFAIAGRARLDEDEARQAWEQIKQDMTDATVKRRVYSRETFANASAKRARAVLEELGYLRYPFHIVISVRPLAELIPSQYSQFVQRAMTTMPFEQWYEGLLRGDTEDPTLQLFWKRHRYERQLRRWGSLVGFENTTVIVVDRTEPLLLSAAFERLLDLQPGTLSRHMGHARGNRALTMGELELVRKWHEVTSQTGISKGEQSRLAWWLTHHLRTYNPDPVDPKLVLPGAAVDRANEIAAATAEAIAASGARVIGDIAALSAVRPSD